MCDFYRHTHTHTGAPHKLDYSCKLLISACLHFISITLTCALNTIQHEPYFEALMFFLLKCCLLFWLWFESWHLFKYVNLCKYGFVLLTHRELFENQICCKMHVNIYISCMSKQVSNLSLYRRVLRLCVRCNKSNTTQLCFFPTVSMSPHTTWFIVVLWQHHPPNMSPHSQKLIQAYKFLPTYQPVHRVNWAEVRVQQRPLCVILSHKSVPCMRQ